MKSYPDMRWGRAHIPPKGTLQSEGFQSTLDQEEWSENEAVHGQDPVNTDEGPPEEYPGSALSRQETLVSYQHLIGLTAVLCVGVWVLGWGRGLFLMGALGLGQYGVETLGHWAAARVVDRRSKPDHEGFVAARPALMDFWTQLISMLVGPIMLACPMALVCWSEPAIDVQRKVVLMVIAYLLWVYAPWVGSRSMRMVQFAQARRRKLVQKTAVAYATIGVVAFGLTPFSQAHWAMVGVGLVSMACLWGSVLPPTQRLFYTGLTPEEGRGGVLYAAFLTIALLIGGMVLLGI